MEKVTRTTDEEETLQSQTLKQLTVTTLQQRADGKKEEKAERLTQRIQVDCQTVCQSGDFHVFRSAGGFTVIQLKHMIIKLQAAALTLFCSLISYFYCQREI